jgi:hypothetical protein
MGVGNRQRAWQTIGGGYERGFGVVAGRLGVKVNKM